MNIKMIIRIISGILFLLLLPVISIFILIVFSPFIILSFILTADRDKNTKVITRHKYDNNIIFNRTGDISKLYGCITRNHYYKWDIFNKALNGLSPYETKSVIDFGAGSLIDSFELAKLGFKITSFDINDKQLGQSYKYYDWNKVKNKPVMISDIKKLADLKKSFNLITAFDVIEHFDELDNIIKLIFDLLKKGGLFFVSVPNKFSAREIFNKFMFKIRKRSGKLANFPGVYHVNFKSQVEWKNYFKENGFTILASEPAIGPFVNSWHFIHSLPFGILNLEKRFPGSENLFSPQFLINRLNRADNLFKKLFIKYYSWQLLVMTRN